MLQQMNCRKLNLTTIELQEGQRKRDSIRHLMTHPRLHHRAVIGMEMGRSPDPGGGSPPNDSPASSGLGRVRGDGINLSIGVGSAVIFDKSVIDKGNDLRVLSK
jgi:hypothetical protein